VEEQKLLVAQEQLAKERVDRAAEVKGLTDKLAAIVTAQGELSRRPENVEADHWWLISQGFSYVFNKLRKSVEFLKPIVAVQQLVWDAGCHNGLLAGYAEATLLLKSEDLAYYKPEAHNQLTAAAEALDKVIYPYLEAVAGLTDTTLEELQALEPKSEDAPAGGQGASVY
jgi:hypothetical protein